MQVVESGVVVSNVPFVVGGVYKFRPDYTSGANGHIYRILVMRGNDGVDTDFAWMDPETGEAAWTGWLEKDEVDFSPYVYCPNARLVVDN